MKGNLVIVESPTKAKKIQGFLGDDYIVKSSFGHIRDLQDNSLSIDVEGGFKPQYVIPSDKTKVVAELKKAADAAQTVWLASDDDREGEAIAWHLSEVLNLTPEKTRRIVFNEVTKPAILNAVKNPREVNMDLVSAQQARRVLDRLVGFELSPVLWKKIQPKLSAGRVQSVALKLVVDREREIEAFGSEKYYKVDAEFIPEGSSAAVKASLESKFSSKEDALDFLKRSIGAKYSVSGINSREGTRTPAAPFTTSTLQQEAVRKLGMSVSQTMQVAQKLYEEGLITYMRTDSVNISTIAINNIKKYICETFGEQYSRPRNYKTKTKGAQEAHEAIRPTNIQTTDINGSSAEKRLYSLIWRRTAASQMADARVLNTTVEITSPSLVEKYNVESMKVLFDGFLKLYMDNDDDDQQQKSLLPSQIHEGCVMNENGVTAECKFTNPPSRYTQGTLIKKLEEMQIGRPATWATIISTLMKGRGYIVEGDKEGRTEEVTNLKLSHGKITTSQAKVKIGAEKRKILPQDIGIMVSDYLVEHFPAIVDYGFTAQVEEDFDHIASGEIKWNGVISSFYTPFKKTVTDTLSTGDYSRLEREIGTDPSDGKTITARYGQFGPYVQKGEGEDRVFASLAKGQIIESLTLDDALKLFQLPRTIGTLNGVEVIAAKGRFGPYLKFGGRNISLPRGKDPLKITIQDAEQIISQADAKPASAVIAQWGDIQLIKGAYGPYLKCGTDNYKLPKDIDPESITEESAKEIIANGTPTAKKKKFYPKKK